MLNTSQIAVTLTSVALSRPNQAGGGAKPAPRPNGNLVPHINQPRPERLYTVNGSSPIIITVDNFCYM